MAKTKKPAESVESISIPEMSLRVLNLRVEGMSPLICHKFSTKAEEMMAAKQAGAARNKKAPKVPEDDFRESLYEVPGMPGRFGFPASAFKKAAVSACRYVEGIPMTKARGAFHVLGDILPIDGDAPTMRKDVVRLNSGMKPVADLRYRGEFKRWAVDLVIRYNAAVITPAQIAHLLNVAGFSVGVGEWRPEKDGSFGMFQVAGSEAA